MKLESREIQVIRSRLRGTTTSILVRLVADRYSSDELNVLMNGIGVGDDHDKWCDKVGDMKDLAACELDDRVPTRNQ